MRTKTLTFLLFTVACALSLTSHTASAQPFGKTLNTGDRILRGTRDWSMEQARRQVALLRSGGLDAVTGQKTLASEKDGNVYFVATKEQAARASKPRSFVLGSGDIYGTAFRSVNGAAMAQR
jgi:hypothetical protein